MRRSDVVAIMQPTFLPWIGYFALMERAETFVFLDSVQFAKRSWQQRNQIKTPSGPQWLTVPVFSKGAQDQLIREVHVDQTSRFAEKTIRTIEMNYAKAPFFKAFAAGLFEILGKKHDLLADLNIDLILHLAKVIGIECRILRSSELGVSGAKADLLAGICEKLKFKIYLSAVGSREYIEQSTAFQDRGIEVVYNPFQPMPYPQLHGPFVPFLSAVDLLLNAGPVSLASIRAGLAEFPK
ncbi:MAG: WbqC family protein [Bdellovibrionota bacterium]